jgi:hypothetical protein
LGAFKIGESTLKQVKLEDVTGQKARPRPKAAGSVSMADTGMPKRSDAVFVEEFSSNAAIGVISAGIISLMSIFFGGGALILAFFQGAAFTLNVGFAILAILFWPAMTWLMLKKSRTAAWVAFLVYVIGAAGSMLVKIQGGDFSPYSMLASGALAIGLWKGVEGISDYHRHFDANDRADENLLPTDDELGKTFE